jgi:hypothetical protein
MPKALLKTLKLFNNPITQETNTMPYIGKIPYEEQVELILQECRDQTWESLMPHVIQWLEKTQWAVESFEEYYVEQVMNEPKNYDYGS